MTRFARATGSKSSNERLPEQATSWKTMKKALTQSEKDAETDKQREKINNIRQANYDGFVKETESKVEKKWSEFPGDQKTQQSPSSFNKKKKFIEANDDDVPEKKSSKTPKQKKAKKNQEDVGNNDKHEKQKQGKKHKIANINAEERQRPKKKKIEETALIIDGVEEELTYVDGFPMRKVDAENLKTLRTEMSNKGVPLREIERAAKLLRRKSERYIYRAAKKICFQCRKSGHLLSDCPEVGKNESSLIQTAGSGICYKCASTEHSHLQCRAKDGYKFATCFICREQGHISRECPDNPKGLYPNGGACKLCGDVTHFKKDCPKAKQEQVSNELFVDTITHSGDIESLDNAPKKSEIALRKQKAVVF